MARSKNRLGRNLADLEGLNSLMGSNVDDEAVANELQYLPIASLRANAEQPRKDFDEDKLNELAASIKEKGILQALLVRPLEGEASSYEIIAGERRWRAAQKVNLAEVPCIIRDVSNDVLEVALIENIQREDLSPMELARAYEDLIRRHEYTQDRLSEILGINRATIANTLRLLRLSSPVQTMVKDGDIVEGAARQLVRIADPVEQLKVARFVEAEQPAVRKVERLVDACMQDGVDTVLQIWSQDLPGKSTKKNGKRSKPSETPASSSKDPKVLEFQESMEQTLGMPVKIQDRGSKGGTIRIDYYTHEEFDRIFAALTGKNKL